MEITLSLAAEAVAASPERRTIGGVVVRFNRPGHTSKGLLRVAPGALAFPEDLGRVKLTREHDRATSRGHLVSLAETADGIRASFKVSDGPDGDDALREAQDRTRDGLSFDVVDAVVVGDTITAGRVVAVGQVGIPAMYDDGRIDTIAAALTTERQSMTNEQRARLAELRAKNDRSAEEETEYTTLVGLAVDDAAAPPAEPPEPAAPAAPASTEPTSVAASMPAIPSGIPSGGTTVTRPRGLHAVIADVTAALRNDANLVEISAALTDITHTDHTANIEQPQWVGELWSGLEYEPEWSDLYETDTLQYWTGVGWRFTQKLEIQDYAGDKAEIPTGDVTTEDVSWDAARMAIGVDVDRKFYDFPNEGFVASLVAQVRESWEIKKDAKIRAHALANAVAGTRTASVTTANADATVEAANGTFSAADVGATITGTGIPAATTILSVTDSGTIELSANATATGTVTATIGAQAGTLLKAAARASLILKRRKVGAADFIVVNDEDMFTLLDVAEDDVPAFLSLFGIEPGRFRSSADVPRGTVLAGRKRANKWRQLPGSPVRVSAQDIAHGGVDEAFFGYWAIEEHHASGLVTVAFKQPA